jgi:hypothetical protein
MNQVMSLISSYIYLQCLCIDETCFFLPRFFSIGQKLISPEYERYEERDRERKRENSHVIQGYIFS